MPNRILVFYGSYRSDRMGIRLAQFVVEGLRARGDVVELIDAREVNLPMLDRMYKEHRKGEAPPALEKLAGQIRDADGFVSVPYADVENNFRHRRVHQPVERSMVAVPSLDVVASRPGWRVSGPRIDVVELLHDVSLGCRHRGLRGWKFQWDTRIDWFWSRDDSLLLPARRPATSCAASSWLRNISKSSRIGIIAPVH